jgi:hypothetical protein
MTCAAEANEILQRLVTEACVRLMMDFGCDVLSPHLTAIAVALQDAATLLTPEVTAEIAEIRHVHAHPPVSPVLLSPDPAWLWVMDAMRY